MGLAARILVGLIHVYRWTLAYFLGGHCRFEPSCSRYGIEAITRFGPWRGLGLTLRRLLRCHPWTPPGFDPVPDRPSTHPTEEH